MQPCKGQRIPVSTNRWYQGKNGHWICPIRYTIWSIVTTTFNSTIFTPHRSCAPDMLWATFQRKTLTLAQRSLRLFIEKNYLRPQPHCHPGSSFINYTCYIDSRLHICAIYSEPTGRKRICSPAVDVMGPCCSLGIFSPSAYSIFISCAAVRAFTGRRTGSTL